MQMVLKDISWWKSPANPTSMLTCLQMRLPCFHTFRFAGTRKDKPAAI